MMSLLVLTLALLFAPADAVISAAVVSAAASAMIAGSSLTGTTMSGLMNINYGVTCGIEIENWTRFPLMYPVVQLETGRLSTPPTDVLPSQREAMVARKTSGSATGTYGTVSWLVEGLNRRIVVMWSAPYNFDHYDNWLGVGLTRTGFTQQRNWFDQMYYYDSTSVLGFERRDYRRNIVPVIYQDDKIRVVGIMGSTHHAKVKITVRPINNTDLADPIRLLLQI